MLLFFVLGLNAQTHQLYALHSKWDDSFKEWEIQTTDEDVEGELTMRWAFKNDPSEWDFYIGDERGQIKLKFPTGLQQWEIRIGNEVAQVKQLWANDKSQWRVTDDTVMLTFKTKYGNNPYDWKLRDDRYGEFVIHTEYEGDPRDWVIIDELDEKIGLAMKVGMAFVAMFQVTGLQ